jgi:hypothetical protein
MEPEGYYPVRTVAPKPLAPLQTTSSVHSIISCFFKINSNIILRLGLPSSNLTQIVPINNLHFRPNDVQNLKPISFAIVWWS